MNKTKTRILSAIATGAILFNSVVPFAFAGEYDFTISGNGSHSDSDIFFENERNTDVFQFNETEIENEIVVSSNTGGNDVSDNTGGDVDVETGDAEIEVSVSNQANSNFAVVDPCDCDGDVSATIHGNGTDSDNEIVLEKEQNTTLTQDNKTRIGNWIDLGANTGDNDVDDNTGGDVSLTTGDVNIKPVQVQNLAGSNVAIVGDGHGGGSGIDLDISGNGSHSDNEIFVGSETNVDFFQFNKTAINNVLDIWGNTGDNDVDDNTLSWGGSLSLDTGDADVEVFVDNAAGFNAASSDCGCVLDVDGSIEHNGTDSDNELVLEVEDNLNNLQDNLEHIGTFTGVDSDTGYNDADDNTNGDLDVETGNASSVVEQSNTAGMNIFGDLEVELPWGWSFFLGL